MSFVRLSPEVVQKLVEHRIDPSESQQWVGEVRLVGEKKTSTRYVLITECCMYLFHKSIKKHSKQQIKSLFDLVSCSVDHDRLKVNFVKDELVLDTPESEALCTNLYRQYRYLTWNVNTKAFTGIHAIAEAMSVPAPQQRPERILLHRYVSMCVSKGVEREEDVLKLASEFDSAPVKDIEFKEFELKSVAPIFSALTMEPGLRSVTFDNFSPTNLGLILVWILVNQNKLLHAKFRNYQSATFKGLVNKRSPFNNMTRVTFDRCACKFVQQFVQALKGATYSLDCIAFRALTFTDAFCETFLSALENYTAMSAIQSLVFIDFECEAPVFGFLQSVVETSGSLKELVVKNCGIDICPFISALNKIDCQLQTLTLRRNYGQTAMSCDEVIPLSLMNLDIGDCDWSCHVMSSFLMALLRWGRRLPLALKLDHSRLSEQWSDVFVLLRPESFRAVLTELDFSYNAMDVRTFELFLTFLASQSPVLTQTPKKLMHLSLSHCFSEDIERCMQLLGEFFSARELWGLSICDTCGESQVEQMMFLIERLRDIQGLISLELSGNFLDDAASDALIQFIHDSPSIAEIGLDWTKMGDVDRLLDLYERIVKSHVLAMKRPIEELAPFGAYPEVKRLNAKLVMKRQFSTTYQRIYLYLSLFSDFATRFIRPYTETDLHDDDPLFENNFRNPIPSLYTVALMSNIDTTVDPLASMVAEYVSTSGRYGIVPPTAPPPDPPSGEFELPAVFATMDPNTDDEDGIDEALDLTSISREIGATMHRDGEHPSIFSNNKRYDPKAMMCLPLADFSS